MKPYEEEKKEDYYIRKFSRNIDEYELKWHKDEEDRTIIPIEENDWRFQMENCLPTPINQEIKIPKGEWHRVIKGTTDLIVKIIKHNE